MRKILIWLVVALILALDWAALHDILKGEPDPRLEYLFLGLSVVFISLLFFKLRRV